jgi:Lauroyl/myristoyl acyltransferase
MKAVFYYISLAFISILSLLPPRVLYILSDGLCCILYYVVRYRRKTVYTNLRTSFPEKTEKEIKIIAKKFYHHLADIFIEYLILYRISDKELEKRAVFKNPELIRDMLEQNKNLVVVAAHYGNWELASIIGKVIRGNYENIAVYKRLHNKYWDKWFIRLRTKFGATLIEMRKIFRHLISNKGKGINSVTFLVADQLPKPNEMKYFVNFLNHEGTAIFLGPEKLAKTFDTAIFYADVQKVKRGYFEIEFIPLVADPKQTAEYEITDLHVRLLEKIIIQKPEYWMWSHKRWKRTEQTM